MLLYRTEKCKKNIDPRTYLEVRSKSVIGVAIISTNEEVKQEAIKEQELYPGVFTYFKNLKEAVSWSSTIIKV